ncbi:MAG: hypothetical protein DMD74_11395 [Gemmatimonadetes bacterium]|nr:MAG: hypothetical protein DMD74_11395 [Gemmatimonadota bacterium]
MEKIIKAAVERGASDLHIKAGDVFRARIDGRLVPLTKQRLTPEQTKAIALRLISSEDDRAKIDRLRDYDCSWGMPGIGRFRVNILRQRSSFMIVMRVIPFDVPTFESLKLPAVLSQVASAERGMILVTGVTGSGKSSTMAAIIHHVNQTQHKHILTLENPMHTPDTVTTVSRIVAMFPPEEQEIARIRLAESLHAVVSQRLLPRADGHGRAAALEVLICTGFARDLIKDANRTPELHNYIQESREQYGMQTFDQHLMDLVSDGTVTYETAVAASSNPADFELKMKTLRRRSRVAAPS